MATITWFDPAICSELPVNCYDQLNPFKMSAGEDAREYYQKALACPKEYPLGSIFIIRNSKNGLADGRYICRDRGGSIFIDKNGVVRLDILSTYPIWKETIEVYCYIE